MFSKTPEGPVRRVKHRKSEDILESIYEIMQNIPVEESPVFVAPNLNNLPCIDLKNVDGPSIVCKQESMQKTVDSVLSEQESMKLQLGRIESALSLLVTPGRSNNAQVHAAHVESDPEASVLNHGDAHCSS